MDNLSKALMIAGEMLIAILVVGLIISAISKFGSFSSNMNSKMQKNKQEEFNNHFYAFQGRIDITAAEIVGIANYAKENNDNSELFLENNYLENSKSPDFVDIKIEGRGGYVSIFYGSSSDRDYKKNIQEFLEKNNDNFYCCNSKITLSSGNMIDIEVDENGEQIIINEQDNGRKGYIKLIKFSPTKLDASTYLTIYNRSEYKINN